LRETGLWLPEQAEPSVLMASKTEAPSFILTRFSSREPVSTPHQVRGRLRSKTLRKQNAPVRKAGPMRLGEVWFSLLAAGLLRSRLGRFA
jgi:hypothetical protein